MSTSSYIWGWYLLVSSVDGWEPVYAGLCWGDKLGHLIVPCIALIPFPAPRMRRVVSQCPICLDLLERPGITDCLHVFW
jgi:hypothetical protein